MSEPRIAPNVFSDAVRLFWQIRQDQALSQRQRGRADQGRRSAVTGGRQMDGFVLALLDQLHAIGVEAPHIHRQARVAVLPGFFRPTKQWDLVIVRDGVLVAAIELKSQVGPSFGNNFNNRTEEALGSAEDLWTAFRDGAFGTGPAPWVGYLLLLEDCSGSQTPVQVAEPHFPVFPEFHGASYARRYELLCRRLVRERKYNAACFLTSPGTSIDLDANYAEPAADLGAEQFVHDLLKHARPG